MSPLPVRFPDEVPALDCDALALRALDETDISAWFERATDAESADLAGDPIPDSIAEGAAWLQRHRDRFRARQAIRWAIVPVGSQGSAGTIGLVFEADDPHSASLGIVINRSHWGRGLATAAIGLIADYAFKELGLRRIEAEVLQRNPASIRLLEKSGFSRERELPGDAPPGAPSEDCYLYALHCADATAGND